MGLLAWANESPIQRSCVLGSVTGIMLYCLPFSARITILLAVVMPGVYMGFAFTVDHTTAMIQELITTQILLYVYMHCYDVLAETNNTYLAPMAIAIHGVVDMLHHFRILYPTEQHVDACCKNYPILCCGFDFSFATTMGLLITIFE